MQNSHKEIQQNSERNTYPLCLCIWKFFRNARSTLEISLYGIWGRV